MELWGQNMLDQSDYLLLKAIFEELRIQNDLKVLELKLLYGELKPSSNIRQRISKIERQRTIKVGQPRTPYD